jgi:Glyoxalase/Bleomycin resistance protein/Dioxygenase superfamily
MTLAVNHVHLKTRDPKRTMQFYIDNFGATFVAEIGTRGYRVNLHGLTLNITTIVDGQTREQHHGIEHIALDTDDYPGTLAGRQRPSRLLSRGARRRPDRSHREGLAAGRSGQGLTRKAEFTLVAPRPCRVPPPGR